jgi:hypothetical protein
MLRRTVSGLCFSLFLGGVMAHAGQFLDAPQYTVGTNPQAVAVGDFNGDGKQDMAVVNTTSATVSVLIGNGDGTFKTKVDYTTGSSPFSIAVGDFNGDGKLDLAVTNSGANTLSIFLGNGDGTFALKSSPATGTAPQGVAVGDFNGDHKIDLVITNSGSQTAGVLIGNGDGTFKTEVTYNTLAGPISVVVGDFNGDGKSDFAVANKNTNDKISVYLGNGDGTFGTQFQYSVGGTPVSITAGDFNGDNKLDLAVAVQTTDSLGNPKGEVSILLGLGTGSFQTLSPDNTAAVPTSVATGDFNGDGVLDLVISSGNDNTVSVLIGNGDGTFKSQINYGTGDIPYSAVVADFNGDGRKDIVVANSGAASVSILLGNGNGTFQTRDDFASGPNVNAVVVADFNGDGILDLAFADSDCVANCQPNAVSVILGNGDGTFQAPNTYSTGTTDTNTYALVAADLNGDGKIDLAAVNNATGTLSVLLGNGDGTFQQHVDYTVGAEPASVAVGDFNGDGHPDLVVSNFNSNTLSILINNGDGTFKPAVSYPVGHGPYSVAAADFNGDKKLDLVVVNESVNNVSVLLGKGDGTFNAATTYATGTGGNPVALVIGDFNGDKVQDLAIADYITAQVSVLIGNGDGTFQGYKQYSTVANPSAITAGDFNADGKLDLALASTSKAGVPGNLVSLLLGNGDGTFGAPTLFPTGSQAVTEAQSIAAADLNGDGALDLVLANGLSSTATVLLNSQGTQITLSSSAGNPSYGTPLTFTANITASVSGDGTPTGTITFDNGSTALGSAVTIAGGTTTLTTSTLPVGTSTISAIYSGDSNFQKHTVTLVQNVNQAGSNSSLASSLNPSAQSQAVMFTATVASNTTGVPTGTVTFLDGTTALSGAMTLANGVASFSSSSLSVGTHSITTSYSGDTNFTANVSPALSQVVNTLPSPAFTLAASAPSPSSVTAGSSSTSTITITASGGLDPTKVALTCAVAPAASKGPTCAFGSINSGGTATLTISTTASTTAMAAHRSSMLYAIWLLLPATVFASVLLPRQKRGKLVMLGAIVFISAGCLFQSACGGSPSGSGGGSTSVPGTPSGVYTISVSGSATGATSQTVTPALTLTVQ